MKSKKKFLSILLGCIAYINVFDLCKKQRWVDADAS